MKRILLINLFLLSTITYSPTHAMESVQDPLRLKDYDGIVKVILSNKSGAPVLVGSSPEDSCSFTLDNNFQSKELSSLYFAAIKTLYNAPKPNITFSSKKGVYELISWKKKNDTMHVDIKLNNTVKKVIKNVPIDGKIIITIDESGRIKISQ